MANTFTDSIKDCPSGVSAPEDDVTDRQLAQMFGDLPSCDKATVVAFPFGGGSGSSGCEQINIAKTSIKDVQRDIACSVQKKIQTSRIDVQQLNEVEIVGDITCKNFNIDQKNFSNVKVLQSFNNDEVDDMKTKMVSAIEASTKNKQGQKIGFMGQGDGSKNMQITTINTEKLKEDIRSDSSLNEMLTNINQKNSFRLKGNMKVESMCNIKQYNQAELVAQVAMNSVLKKISKNTTDTNIRATTENTQEVEAKGIADLFSGLFAPCIAAATAIAVICVCGIILCVATGSLGGSKSSSSSADDSYEDGYEEDYEMEGGGGGLLYKSLSWLTQNMKVPS
tara:strand:- start:2844 stop:3854 length:1011 start_codon:yes stop_codon:yes gene_type:complete